MAFFKPPLRDRTVLYLLSYSGYDEAHEVPPGLTQMGMAKALGCKRAQVAQVLIELKGKGMARERVCHVKGSPRRMKAFVLTPDGRSLGENLRKSVLERPVQFVDEDGEPDDLTIKDVLNKYPRQLDITAFMRLVDAGGNISREKVTDFIEKGHKEDRVESPEPLECETAEKAEALQEEEQPEQPAPEPIPPLAPEVEVPGQAPTHLETEGMEMGPVAPPLSPPPPVVPPTIYYGPEPVMAYQPLPPPQPRPRSLFARGSLLLGFMLMFIGGLMPFSVQSSQPQICIFAIPLFITGIVLMVLYYVAMRMAKVEKLTKGDRYSVIIVALILAYILGFFASLIIDYDHFKWDSNVLWSYLLVQVPLCFVLGAFFLIPAETRGQLGVVIGTFLLALSVSAIVGGAPFAWMYVHPVMWMVTGVLAASVGNEVERPDRRRLMLWVSSGIGLFMIVAAGAVMKYALGSGFENLNLHTSRFVVESIMALWAVLGIIIIGLRFASKERLDGLYSGLGYTAVVCIGTAFFLFGIWFMKLGRFEGAIDLLIGLPVVYYALIQLKDSGNSAMKLVGALMTYAVIVESLSLGLALGLV